MLFNGTHLLNTSESHETVTLMLITQHALLLFINLATLILNFLGLVAVYRNKLTLAVTEILIGSSALIDLTCGMTGLTVDILFYTKTVDCSGSCELTFGLDSQARPSSLVTLLRYGSDVTRNAHYLHMFVSTVHHWVFVNRPLVYHRLARRRWVLLAHAATWSVCILSNLPTLVEGLALDSDDIYFNIRFYFTPVYHTVFSAIVCFFYCIMAHTAVRQIGEVTKLEKIQSRLQSSDTTNDCRRRSQTQKHLYVVQMFIFIFGTFVLTMSPAVYIRAFRTQLPTSLTTVGVILSLDVLLSTHYVMTFIISATNSRPFNRAICETLYSLYRNVYKMFCLSQRYRSETRRFNSYAVASRNEKEAA